MKKTGYIFLLLAAWTLPSCIFDPSGAGEDLVTETSGVMTIEIKDKTGEAEDKMKTIRFLVFKDATTSPKLELNKLFTIPDVNPGDKEASSLKVILEVSRKTSGINDKRVFAIVNEPTGMTAQLESVTTEARLQALELELADFLNAQHTSLSGGKTLPMTGMMLTSKVYATPEEAEAGPESITLERAVARVDVYMQKEAGSTIDLAPQTTISLGNTYPKEYFIRHETSPGIFFGKIITNNVESDFTTKTWSSTATVPLPVATTGSKGQYICSFYVAERTCSGNDKLKLNVNLKSTGGEERTGSITLDKAWHNEDGEEKLITDIRRNNNYRILVTVENSDITVRFKLVILEWTRKEISVIW